MILGGIDEEYAAGPFVYVKLIIRRLFLV